MRLKSVALALVISAQTFCLPLQQSLAQTPRTRGTRTTQGARAQAQSPAQVEVSAEDSEAFLQSATRRRPTRDYTREVETLLRRMTLEEKVGQMTQLEIGMVTTGGDQTIQIDQAKLEKAVVKYGVGSILNV